MASKWKASKTSDLYHAVRKESSCKAVVFAGGWAGSKKPYNWYVQQDGADLASGPAGSVTTGKKKANAAFAKCVASRPLAGARRKRRRK